MSEQTVSLSAGRVHYLEAGSGPPIVFIGAFLTDHRLWRKVVPLLSDRHRCITPDWPVGAHTEAMRPDADLSLPGLARLVAEFLEVLDLRDVTLLGNDSGGAITQLVATDHPERVGRIVLLPCDAFENCPPKLFRYLKVAARVPGATGVLLNSLRIRPARRLPIAFGWLTKRPIERNVVDAWLRPAQSDADVRRDAAKVALGLDPVHTQRAAQRLRSFDKPVLVAWPREDRLFPFAHAERLAALVPNGRLEVIEHALTLVAEDQPGRVAELIARFVADTTKSGSSGEGTRSSTTSANPASPR